MDANNVNPVDGVNVNTSVEEQVVTFMFDLAAFNKLNKFIVDHLSSSFNVNAELLCKRNGITYWIK